MLKLTYIEFFLRTLPEIFILVYGIHILSKKSIDIKKYIFCSIVLSILTFFVRWLPIYFGVHTIIDIILTISMMFIIKITLMTSIYNTFVMYFLLSISEFINMGALRLLNINTSIDFYSPYQKCILGLPSLIIVFLFIIISKYISKRGAIQDVYN
ncbi:hypothetical protein CLPUN_44290 [Clostridium puniceum]|uniref:Uncharacterized protein n=1 Tax=Clostridium puniceum TaxID=29367 RepID=A0A1S8T886_9CLOT|nr:hypothetical protein [Clostridium puniceum]OOM73675.1 hypothetical protein CLPUN_44290 [Clostridium puniceum]